ncbi:MAG: sulfatase-like hydrolase/transferase [Bryobacteraceae bacterium]
MPATSKTNQPGNYVLIVLDSCRYDSFTAARPATMRKLGRIEKRWSYASWTAPSHYNLLMGLMPHSSPRNILAAEYYQREFLKFNRRLGIENLEFKSFLPRLYLPVLLRKLGISTRAMVSLPVLNPATPLNTGFDSWELMDRHNDMRAMLPKLTFPEQAPTFWLLNTGETHYPYALPSEPPGEWPAISGVHGVFRHLDELIVGGKLPRARGPFSAAKLAALRGRQIDAVRYLDRVIEELFDLLPKNTYVTITSDHGELFGEDGYFGHGPIQHEKVFEVPFIEGRLR